MLTPTWPCKELGLIPAFVHRPTALKHQRVGEQQATAEEEEAEKEEEVLPPPTQEREVSTNLTYFVIVSPTRYSVELKLHQLYFMGRYLSLTLLVSLQIGMLTYAEWVLEAMGRQVVKKEVEEEEEIVVVRGEEDDEGVGREAQQGGEVHPSGGTDSSFAEAVPTLEVQQAIRHAVRVSQGRALPSKTTIIAPNPALLSPPPQESSSLLGLGPSGALTLGVRRAIAVACKQVKVGAVPLHHSPHCSRPAPHPTPQPLVPVPTVPVQPTPTGTGVGQAATEPPLPQQRLLSEVPVSARGARWQLRQKPYAPWTPTQTQL